MKLAQLIDFTVFGDVRGSLVSLEQNKNIPFEVKRVYYIFDTQAGVSRGFHAHKHLEQVLICLKGSCRFVLDNGQKREQLVLNSPTKGLYVGHNLWREMHDFSKDCVLLVLACDHYHESDYIRDYDAFMEVVNKNDS